MGLTEIERRAADATRAHNRFIGSEIRRIREDAGVSLRRLAEAAGVSRSFLSQIEAGLGSPSVATLNRIAAALGGELSIRLYPNTGPVIRDRSQAPMIEGLLRILHPRWRPNLEVAVRHPARGIVDAVLDDRLDPVIVAVESESDLRRVEQHLRWSKDKAQSLPSSDLWRITTAERDPEPRISQLLLVRSTRHNRAVVKAFRETFVTAYPADPDAIRRALTTADEPWPGPGLLWMTIVEARARILDRAPPGLARRDRAET